MSKMEKELMNDFEAVKSVIAGIVAKGILLILEEITSKK